jgi:hypothetical protein
MRDFGTVVNFPLGVILLLHGYLSRFWSGGQLERVEMARFLVPLNNAQHSSNVPNILHSFRSCQRVKLSMNRVLNKIKQLQFI